jgi:hypothetical protein
MCFFAGAPATRTNHARAVEARHAVGTHVGAASIGHGFAINRTFIAPFPDGPRLHDEIHFAGRERQHDLSCTAP